MQVGAIEFRCPKKFLPGMDDQGVAAQGDHPVAAQLLQATMDLLEAYAAIEDEASASANEMAVARASGQGRRD